MKIVMTPRRRYTGNSHTITNETIKPSSIKLEDDGRVTISVKIGPIDTSGDFNGRISLPLSELYLVLGIIEEKKLVALMGKPDA